MYIVGHEDDDLLFMGPDVKNSILRGNSVMLVYLTAGQVDPKCGPWDLATHQRQWAQRELGILDAYRRVAGPGYLWLPSIVNFNMVVNGQSETKHAVRYDLQSHSLSIVFFRLEDGGLESGWNSNVPGAGVRRLACTASTCAYDETALDEEWFDREELVNSLQSLMSTFQADSVSTTDASALYWSQMGGPGDPYYDFGSHVAAANFAVAALTKYQAAPSTTTTKHLRMYRGYSATQEYENLSPAERDDKAATFQVYANWDCAHWYQRKPQGAPDDQYACYGTTDVLCGDEVNTGCGQVTLSSANGWDYKDARECPVFSEHWARTYADRSLLGTGPLQGRLAMTSSSGATGCLSIAGATPSTRTNAVASSGSGGTAPSKAIDGSMGTKWVSAASDPQWIYVDLGSSQYVTRVRLAWDAGYARSFQIQVSDDAISWTTKYTTTTGTGGTQTIALPADSKGRYVRMYGTQRATTGGYALFDFGIDTFTTVATSYTCASAPSWVITPLQQIQLLGTSSCLQASGAGTVTIGSCSTNRESSTFFLMSNGQLQASPTNNFVLPEIAPAMCLGGSDSNGGPITNAGCAKKCVDEVSGVEVTCSASYAACTSQSQCSSTEVCLGACYPRAAGKPANNQNWTLLFDTPTLRSTQFGDDTEVGSASYYYRTFGIANRNVCVRRTTGVYCAPFSGGAIQSAQQLTSGFADGDGWASDPNGSTVAAVWDSAILPNGQTIACGRGYYGAGCTTGGTSSFSNAEGWADAAYYYDSIRYVDVTGDGHPDICGRGYYGVSCAMNLQSSFTTASLWTSSFSAAASWNAVGTGDAIQFGDIDGDGRTDVCGRGDYGIDCATGTNSAFLNYKPWSFDRDRRVGDASTFGINRDFANADIVNWKSSPAYYASVKLVDVNRDGFADACGRGPGGIYCAFSVGHNFAPKRLVLPEDFTDPGWAVPDKGSTITFGDLDGDARVDVCGRGYYGIVCGEGY